MRPAARRVMSCWQRGAALAQPAIIGVAASRCASTCTAAASNGQLRAAVLGLGAFSAASLGWAGAALASSKAERTFIAIKPDGVHRGLIADIIKRFESKGYKLVGVKMVMPSRSLAGAHYAEHDGKPFFPKLVDFLSSGPVLAMVWEGKDVIKAGRAMIGTTNPLSSAPGTIRGDYGVDVGRNIIHGSDSVESAQREISLWFKPEELAEWVPVGNAWIYE